MNRICGFILAVGATLMSGCAPVRDSGRGNSVAAISVPTNHIKPAIAHATTTPLKKIAYPAISSAVWILGEHEDLNLKPEIYDQSSSSLRSDLQSNEPITVHLALVKRVGEKSRWFFEVHNAASQTWMGRVRVCLMNDNTEIYEQDLKLEFAAYAGLQADCEFFDIAAFPANMGGNINGYKWAVSREGFQSVISSETVVPETRQEQPQVTKKHPEEQIYWQQTGTGQGNAGTPIASPNNQNERADRSLLGSG